MWSALCTVGFLPIVAVSLAGAGSLEQNPRELTVREGEPVTFQCSMTRGAMRDYSMSWYRQGPSGIQEWIYKNDGYGSSFQNRFKIKDESRRNRFPLQILLAKQEDAATYYCQAESPWNSSAAAWTKNHMMGKTHLSAFLSSSCTPGL